MSNNRNPHQYAKGKKNNEADHGYQMADTGWIHLPASSGRASFVFPQENFMLVPQGCGGVLAFE